MTDGILVKLNKTRQMPDQVRSMKNTIVEEAEISIFSNSSKQWRQNGSKSATKRATKHRIFQSTTIHKSPSPNNSFVKTSQTAQQSLQDYSINYQILNTAKRLSSTKSRDRVFSTR